MKQQIIYFGINKNGAVRLFVDEPVRNGDIWTGNYYLNSVLQKQLEEAIKDANLTWESDCQCIQVNIPTHNDEPVDD